jgi:DNA-binding MltR family transcriptional regulator
MPPDIDDRLVEHVAKAMYEHAVEQGRAAVAAINFPLDSIKSVFHQVLRAGDREAGIVIFALIDDLATDFFRQKLSGTATHGVEETFLAGNGMLATTHNKISLLAGLEWIRSNVYRELTLLRKIRNAFAHHVNLRLFDDVPIRGYIGSMDRSEDAILISMSEGKRPETLSCRTKFIVRSANTVCLMVEDFAIIQASIAHRVHPGSILAGEFEDQPENIKALLRTVAEISLIAIEQNAGPKLEFGLFRRRERVHFPCAAR